MPPRKKPISGATAVRNDDPADYLTPFVHYQQTECGLSANTVAAYRSDLVQFLTWWKIGGPQRLTDVALGHLSQYLQHLHDRALAASSIARHLVAIKMFFRYLVLEGVLVESVADLVSSPKLWEHLPHVLSPDNVDRLLAAPLPGDRFFHRDRALLAVLYATGCRVSEVSGLQLRDVHLAEGFCRCLGKGNKERLVSLNPVARAAIEQYLQGERPRCVRNHPAEELFVSRSGRPLSRIRIWYLVKRYAERVGISAQVSPHTLRHSFATHLLAGGAEIRALQELLGHASIRTTQIYTHVEHSRLKNVHRRCHPRG